MALQSRGQGTMAHSVRDCATLYGEGDHRMNSFTSRKYYRDFEALNAFIPLCVMSAVQIHIQPWQNESSITT